MVVVAVSRVSRDIGEDAAHCQGAALAANSTQVVAIASDRPKEETDPLPIFNLDDVSGIADFIVAYLRLARP